MSTQRVYEEELTISYSSQRSDNTSKIIPKCAPAKKQMLPSFPSPSKKVR
jgi:hypothetical protein